MVYYIYLVFKLKANCQKSCYKVRRIYKNRGVNIQLDLHTKKVMYSDKNNSKKTELYKIKESYSGPNGWTVCVVEFGDRNGRKSGSYVQTRGKNWVEKNVSGKTTFKFVETHRDEWSAYLSDTSRGVNIQLDLYTQKVMYSDRRNTKRTELYKIRSTR